MCALLSSTRAVDIEQFSTLLEKNKKKLCYESLQVYDHLLYFSTCALSMLGARTGVPIRQDRSSSAANELLICVSSWMFCNFARRRRCSTDVDDESGSFSTEIESSNFKTKLF